MRLLIDECIPRKFKASLTTHGHECLTVPEAGFAGKKMGNCCRPQKAISMFLSRWIEESSINKTLRDAGSA